LSLCLKSRRRRYCSLLKNSVQFSVHVQSNETFLGFLLVRSTELGYLQVPAFIERETEFRFLAVGNQLIYCIVHTIWLGFKSLCLKPESVWRSLDCPVLDFNFGIFFLCIVRWFLKDWMECLFQIQQ
jgi:hypothetical protein